VTGTGGPHDGQPVETAGAPPQAATAAVVMLHGRGDSANRFLRLIDEFHHRGVIYLAPEAAGKAWFPGPLDAPPAAKEPWLSSAFALVDEAFAVAEDASVPRRRTVVMGFSQGACLAAEYVATRAHRYGGLAAIAGGLLGPDPSAIERPGSLDGTPAYFACGADDPRIDSDRVVASADAFRTIGANVSAEVYDGLGHAINDAEIARIDGLVADVAEP